MGSKLVGWSWDYRGAPLSKLVLLALAERATDDNGVCAGGSVPVVARMTGLSVRSVQYHIKRLGGLVERTETTIVGRTGAISPGPNRYRLLAPWTRPESRPVLREDRATFAGVMQKRSARLSCTHGSPICAECFDIHVRFLGTGATCDHTDPTRAPCIASVSRATLTNETRRELLA